MPKRQRSNSMSYIANDNKKRVKTELVKHELVEMKPTLTTSSLVPGPQQIYADPTYDSTFKMLFNNSKHKDILISLLNSLLDLRGKKEIIEIELDPNELPISTVSNKQLPSAKQSIDILCTNRSKQKIAVEMQGQKTIYFLARQQAYMAKLISGQITEGISAKYHQEILETHIIVIARNNIFVGNTALTDQNLFEIDFFPMSPQTNQMFPGNKMYWKFFELPKFAESSNYKNITADSPLKEQWLEFLIECKNNLSAPARAAIIEKGYEVMKISEWSSVQQAVYWKQEEEAKDLIASQELEKRQSRIEGKIEGKIEGEIKQVLLAIQYHLEIGLFADSFEYIKGDQLVKLIDYINNGHQQDKAEEIATKLNFFAREEVASNELLPDVELVGTEFDSTEY